MDEESPDEALQHAMTKKKKNAGCWSRDYETLHSSEMMYLEETEELFANVHSDLTSMVKLGGSVIQGFNKKVSKALSKMQTLKKSYSKRKVSSKTERAKVERMIEQSIEFMVEFKEEFSPVTMDGSAISGLIDIFEEDDIFRCLAGKRTCNKTARKLKAVVKNNKPLAFASWSALSAWKVGPRGFQGTSSSKGRGENFRNQGRGNISMNWFVS